MTVPAASCQELSDVVRFFAFRARFKHRLDRGTAYSDSELTELIQKLDCSIDLADYSPSFRLLTRIISATLPSDLAGWWQAKEKVDTCIKQELKVLESDDRAKLIVAAAQFLDWVAQAGLAHAEQSDLAMRIVYAVIERAKQRNVSFSESQLKALLQLGAAPARYQNPCYLGNVGLLAVDALAQSGIDVALDTRTRDAINQLVASLQQIARTTKDQSRLAVLKKTLGVDVELRFCGAEPWSRELNTRIGSLLPAERFAVRTVMEHAQSCNLSKPSKPWVQTASRILTEVEPALRFGGEFARWSTRIVESGGVWADDFPYGDEWRQAQTDLQLLGSAACVAGVSAQPEALRALAALAEFHCSGTAIQKLNRFPFAAACVRAIALADSSESLAQLHRLSLRIRWPKLKKIVKKLYDQAVERTGMSRDDVEETLLPDFGLDRDGIVKLQFGDGSAELTIGGSDKPNVSWRVGDKLVRSAPAALKAAHPDAVPSVKQLQIDIEKMRGAQRTRLDLLFRRTKTWSFSEWQSRYIEHGLMGSLARRLIWSVDDVDVIWHGGQLCRVDGSPVSFASTAEVKLWHPADSNAQTVLAWRQRLQLLEITQPFKQAHREIYLLTDAERRTNNYSNRFAAHILRTPTMLAITQTRGWKAGMFGGESSPSLELPDYGLRAEWWLQPASDEYSDWGAPRFLATDQLRFYALDASVASALGHANGIDQPVAMEQISRRPFTEVMRDIDFFVDVASIGNDPNWLDSGGQERYNTYWHSYSFGDLTESAKTRKAVLETLLPRLSKIRDRCRLEDKFLIVRGELRTYKIHLGSGNILMEPNDQYLCIVPDRKPAPGGEKLFLPFEGDSTLAIVLSKAFMLADDVSIKDPSITRQIRP